MAADDEPSGAPMSPQPRANPTRPAKPSAPSMQPPAASSQSASGSPSRRPPTTHASSAPSRPPTQPVATASSAAKQPSSAPAARANTPATQKSGIPNSALALAAIVVGLGVGFLTFAFGSASDRTPTASIQMVLDEDQTGWPFYAAVQEEAIARLNDPAMEAAVKATLTSPTDARELWGDRPGDLSLFFIYATADSDDVALDFATAAAAQLQADDQAVRRSTETARLTDLQSRSAGFDARIAELSATLDTAEEESARVVARGELQTVSSDRSTNESAISGLEAEIATIGPSYRPAGPAVVETSGAASILAALAAAAAAAALTLLALSFVAPPRRD